jgi:heat-inducible transcription repressor HrcA
VVQEYIITGEPVSSRKIAKKYGINLSPATIRNVMAELVEMEYLYQPHTSAGRIPTNIGLKFFVDTFLENKELSPQKKKRSGENIKKPHGKFRD